MNRLVYSNHAIELGLILKSVYHLPLRQLQGFIEGMFHLLNIELQVPNYSTFSRRASDLDVALEHIDLGKPIHLVIDATGMKIHGEGEWHMRTHGKSKRRKWKKFHVGVDVETRQITALTMTESNVHDSLETGNLIHNTSSEIETVTGDKAYDNKHAYDAIAEVEAWSRTPPRSGAALTKNPNMGQIIRNFNIRNVWTLGAKKWKEEVGYHDRSLVENTFYRYKTILGPKLRVRNFSNQNTELRIGAQILNRMTHLGMPKSQIA